MILNFSESYSDDSLIESCIIECNNQYAYLMESVHLFTKLYMTRDEDDGDCTILKEAASDVANEFVKVIMGIIGFIVNLIDDFSKWLDSWARLIFRLIRTMPDGIEFDAFSYTGYQYRNTFNTSLMQDLQFFGYPDLLSQIAFDVKQMREGDYHNVELSDGYVLLYTDNFNKHVRDYYRPNDKTNILIDNDSFHPMVNRFADYRKYLVEINRAKISIDKDLRAIINIVTKEIKEVENNDPTEFGAIIKKWNRLQNNITKFATGVSIIASTKIQMIKDECYQIREIQTKAISRVHILKNMKE